MGLAWFQLSRCSRFPVDKVLHQVLADSNFEEKYSPFDDGVQTFKQQQTFHSYGAVPFVPPLLITMTVLRRQGLIMDYSKCIPKCSMASFVTNSQSKPFEIFTSKLNVSHFI